MNKSTKIKASLTAAALLAVGGVATFSLLSDTSSTSIAVTSATFELAVNDSATGTFVVDINASNLAPGETREGDITLKNNSSIPATVTLAKNTLVNYTAAVNDGATGFTTVTLAPGGTKDLDLKIGLDASETGSPAAENLTLTFNANQ